MSKENVNLIREGYEALSRQDIAAWLQGVDPDVELHELAEIPDTAVYRGREGLRQWAEAALELVEDWRWEPEEFIQNSGGIVVVRVRFTARGRGSGAPVDQVIFHVLDVRDGKVAVIRGFLDQEDAVRENPPD